MKRASDRARMFAVLEHLGIPAAKVPPVNVVSESDHVRVTVAWMQGVDLTIDFSRARFDEWMDDALRMSPDQLRGVMMQTAAAASAAAERESAKGSPFDN